MNSYRNITFIETNIHKYVCHFHIYIFQNSLELHLSTENITLQIHLFVVGVVRLPSRSKTLQHNLQMQTLTCFISNLLKHSK